MSTSFSYNREIFRKNLKVARKALGLSQKAIHEKTGIAASYVSDVERGTRNVTLDVATCLSEAVGQSLRRMLKP